MLMGGAVAAPPGRRARQRGKAESGEILAIEPRRSGQGFAGRRGNWQGAAWLATERTPTSGKIAAARRFGKRMRRDLIRRPGRAKRAKDSVARGAMEWRGASPLRPLTVIRGMKIARVGAKDMDRRQRRIERLDHASLPDCEINRAVNLDAPALALVASIHVCTRIVLPKRCFRPFYDGGSDVSKSAFQANARLAV
jgi:hypothetical protein